MKVARSEASSTKNEWLEDELFPRLSSVASGGATNGSNIVVAAGEGVYFRRRRRLVTSSATPARATRFVSLRSRRTRSPLHQSSVVSPSRRLRLRISF
jgi:hypothetical protein